MRVLVVEDDEDVRTTLVKFFEDQEDIQLETTASGDSALGMAIRTAYDLVILDLHLPGVGGLDILPVLRSSAPRAIIAILSGYVDLATPEDEALVDAIMTKPFSIDALADLITLTREITEKRAAIRKLGVG